jgi:CDGSH-type Zn-finger protein
MIKDKRNVAGQHNAEPSKREGHKIVIAKNGPYIVSGSLPLGKEVIVADEQGTSLEYEKGEQYPAQETYALCRCGHSKSKPFCDGTHARVDFNGAETASRKKYLAQAEKIEGPSLILTDAQDLCAAARFCHLAGGVWKNVRDPDPKSKGPAIQGACNCPSGRLVVYDKKTGRAIEPELEPSVSLLEDPYKGVSGPIFVKGGVPVESSDGTKLEKRNRVTLCRCGQSINKPYCDGSHIDAGFNDGDRSIN